jgi:hypothetical protein
LFSRSEVMMKGYGRREREVEKEMLANVEEREKETR